MNHSQMLSIKIKNNRTVQCPKHTPLHSILPSEESSRGLPYIGALVNNDIHSLSDPLEVDAEVAFLDLTHSQGWHIYRRSLSFLLSKAVRELFTDTQLTVEYSLGTGFFCLLYCNGEPCVAGDKTEAIEAYMRRDIAENIPIFRSHISFQEAVNYFENERLKDKLNSLRYRNPPNIAIYRCANFMDLAHGVMADRTGSLEAFKLFPYKDGFVLQFPDKDRAPEFAAFEPQENLFQIFKEYKNWGKILGVQTAGDLNELVAHGDLAEMVRITEALQEKKIAQIADQLAENREHLKWIFLAGPSSSGKTTFAKRLAVQLKVNGLNAYPMSIDDYFVDRSRTPRDEKGDPDFEHIKTVDIEFLHQQLQALDAGEEVKLPRFNFETGEREFRGHTFSIQENQVVIVEGIHGLNPCISEVLPADHIAKIYVSALAQLSLDNNNRIPTTDTRLIRRIVRDYKFRGHDARTTIKMWPNVRKGEKTWIFPYQQEAGIVFNSALDYELSVLKSFVEPLLAEVKPWDEEYAQARRILGFLNVFLPINAGLVPPTSLLREFIGRSGFRY